MSARVGVATGAGRGIGLACARRMIGAVDTLFLVDLDAESVGKMAAELSSDETRTVPIVMDVSDPADVGRLVETVAAEGSLRAVAHAAGISTVMGDWKAVVRVDLVGTALLIDGFRPLVVPGTAMVCFASMAAQIVVPTGDAAVDAMIDRPLDAGLLDLLRDAAAASIEDTSVAYAWAKRGVQRLVRREAISWGRLGGRINSISPGHVDTPMGRLELESHPEIEALRGLTPLGRSGRAEELAAAAAFLLSDEASFVTGVDLLVDGGVVAAIEAARWTPSGPAES